MKWIALTISLIFTGCASSSNQALMQPVSLSAISGDILQAGNAVDQASRIAFNIEKMGAQPHDTNVVTQISILAGAKASIEKGKVHIASAEAKLAKQADETNKVIDRLNYIELKWALAKKLIWKWRALAIGTWVAIVGFVAIKVYSKFPIPLPL